ncbi:hypothetical protein [Sphingobacterium sp. UBA6645]|uniref:hypothetical protein n=1 Tax=Sphingobacterium sp. UBA6645 TaxID=1947511 RepID=UPI0025E619F3|nr:hypothetical protein [Sphingobacterium sp. UBA6645]
MREKRFILSVCFLIILFCKIGSAQSLQVGVFNVNGVVYKVDKIANNTDTVVIPRDLVLQPDNPITVNGIPTEILIEGIIVNRDDGWFKYAKETLSASRISQLKANNDWIRFHYWLKSDGTCYYGSFNLKNASSLTITEIAKMYMHIKSNFKPFLMSPDARHLQLNSIPVDGGIQDF